MSQLSQSKYVVQENLNTSRAEASASKLCNGNSPQPLGGSDIGLPRSHKITNLLGYRKSRFIKKEAQREKRKTKGKVGFAGDLIGRPYSRLIFWSALA